MGYSMTKTVKSIFPFSQTKRKRKSSSKSKRKLPQAFKEFQKAKMEAIRTGASSFTLNGKTYKRSRKSIGGVPVYKGSKSKSKGTKKRRTKRRR